MGWLDKLLGRDKEAAPTLSDADAGGAMGGPSDMAGDAEDAAEDMSHGDEPSADEAGGHSSDER